MKKIFTAIGVCLALFSFVELSAQSKAPIALNYLQSNLQTYQLSPTDIAEIKQGYEYTDEHNGVTHIYFTQRYQGVEVYNGEININIDKNNKILNNHLLRRWVEIHRAKPSLRL
jgi:extracellular elastinolytic metalloproteinase